MRWVIQADGSAVVERPDTNEVTDFANYIGADGEIYYVQNVGRALAHCSELRKDSGWSGDRTMKRTASIPLIEYLKHPALGELETNEEIERYISKYLPQYSNCHESKGVSSPKIIVK